ncbi:hypothetical protein D1823_17470 [Ruegeria sp. AD91A]|uniref:hypothetical protein n=1 Tax=Ruegeria sp. AD91A TaxID=2293862 RepID=UPI000E5185CC|nr:hypothetical protein [Ruegeria sp. AD91A]AXT28198.1 hypothetical protein D1823_17470 [Ruegeria sp. AD91A]
MRLFLTAICVTVIGVTAHAACPSKAPKLAKSNFSDGDQKVNAAWLQKNLGGHKVVYAGKDTETYFADGSYSYKSKGQTWKANTYKFYDNGMRCIGYQKPRFDLYVVNDGKLVLVNEKKERYVGQIRK